MTTRSILPAIAVVLFGVSILHVWAVEPPAPKPDVPKKPLLVRDAYPGLASNSLTYARLSDLPSGVLLRTDGLTIKDKDVAEEIAKAPQEMQAQLKKNAFFVLEDMTTRKLLVVLAKAKAPEQKKDAPVPAERELVQKYLKEVVADNRLRKCMLQLLYTAVWRGRHSQLLLWVYGYRNGSVYEVLAVPYGGSGDRLLYNTR